MKHKGTETIRPRLIKNQADHFKIYRSGTFVLLFVLTESAAVVQSAPHHGNAFGLALPQIENPLVFASPEHQREVPLGFDEPSVHEDVDV